MKYIDLFGGIGGFSYGIEQATKGKWECVWYCDNNKYAVQTYNKNYGENYEATDITTVKTTDIPDHDCICGGFPCQTFSIAGKRRGFEDIRGTMFFEIMRIAKAKRTKYLFLENVKGLLNHNKGKTFTTILQTLEELGYETQWMVLNSKFFGVPQNRERVFIIASLRGTSKPEVLPFREDAEKVSGLPEGQEQWQMRLGHTKSEYAPLQYKSNITRTMEANGSLAVYDRKGFDSRTKGFRENKKISPTLTQKMGTGGNNVPMVHQLVGDRDKPTIIRQRPKYVGGKRTLITYEYDESPTIGTNVATGDQKNIVSGTITQAFGRSGHSKEEITMWEKNQQSNGQLRRLTPVECERLQGFPDGWTEGVSDTQRYKQMGNAVTTNVIEAIVRSWKNGGNLNKHKY